MALLPIPPKPNPADALATFLGVHPAGMGASDGGYSSDPALELSRLRGARADELKARIPTEQATGDKLNGMRDLGNLFQIQGDMAADPDTGTAAHQDVANTEAALNKASLSMRPEITDAEQAASAAKIKEARGLSEANAEGPLAAQTTPAGIAAAKQKTDEGIRALAAQFGLQGQGEVDSAPVHSTPEGVKWIDASAIDKKGLPQAMKAAADKGIRLVTDKQTVQQLQDVDSAGKNLDYVQGQLASKLAPDYLSRPEKYAKNTLGQFFQSDADLAGFFRTLQPIALQVYRTVGGMKGAGGMRMGPGIVNLAQGIMPSKGDSVGTMTAMLNDLKTGLASVRTGQLSGTVGGQAPTAAPTDNSQHVTIGPDGSIVPYTGKQ